jgi:kynureninase
LGLQPKSVRSFIEKELLVWQEYAVEGHFKKDSQWYSYHKKVTDSLAKLTGAKATEVVAMNSLTTNLHLMLISFLRPKGSKNKILCDFPSFPSDKYAFDSALKLHGLNSDDSLIRFETLQGNDLATTDQWIETIENNKDQLCLVYLNPINYLTGQLIDVQAISAICQKFNIPIGFDLAHSIGNVELELNKWGIDFAIWCSYKYLNASPGAVGGCFVHERHHNSDLPRLEGWWGTNPKSRFNMSDKFESSQTAEAWQLSNPPILMIAALRASLDVFEQTSLKVLRKVGDDLTNLFIDSVEQSHLKEKLHIINGNSPRGNMLCIRLKTNDSKEIYDKLCKKGIILDQRKPDILRFSFCPLYNTETEVEYLIESMSKVLH